MLAALTADGVLIEASSSSDAATLLANALAAGFEGATVEEVTQQQLAALVAATAPVPREITMRQARLALLQIGVLQAVEDQIQQLASPLREAAVIAWEYSTVVRRDDSLVPVLQSRLGWSNEYMDQLFAVGAAL